MKKKHFPICRYELRNQIQDNYTAMKQKLNAFNNCNAITEIAIMKCVSGDI